MSKAFGKSIFEKKKMKLTPDEMRAFIKLRDDFKADPTARQFALFTQKASGRQALAVVDRDNKLITANYMSCGSNERTKVCFETITFMMKEKKKLGKTFMDLTDEFEAELEKLAEANHETI